MNRQRSLIQCLVLCGCLAISPWVTAQEENIVVDANGDYVITYRGDLGWEKVTWIPATKINPSVSAIVRPADGKPGNLRYRYAVRNGKDGRQFVGVFRLSASNVLSSRPQSPSKWSGDVTLEGTAGSGFSVGWVRFSGDGPWQVGVKPGETLPGFAFFSKDLPGVGTVSLYGARKGGQSFPDSGPDENSPIYAEFIRIQTNDEVTRLAAVPRVGVPSPYDAATILTNIQKHLDTDIVNLKLVDSTLVVELDRWLTAAISAAKSGNDKALRADIHEARKLLKQEHEDVDKDDNLDQDDTDKATKTKSRIDRLAARVLDFDLRYVESRISGKNHD